MGYFQLLKADTKLFLMVLFGVAFFGVCTPVMYGLHVYTYPFDRGHGGWTTTGINACYLYWLLPPAWYGIFWTKRLVQCSPWQSFFEYTYSERQNTEDAAILEIFSAFVFMFVPSVYHVLY